MYPMEYFLIKNDDRIFNPLKIQPEAMDFDAKEAFIVYTDFGPNTVFIDCFFVKKQFTYLFGVSDALKELLDIYADHISAVPFFVTDRRQRGQKVYWSIQIELIDCIEMNMPLRYDSITIQQEKVKDKHIFRVAFEKQEYLVISLQLAENLLRKKPTGIQFIPVNVR